jgi:hypothetical protein
LNKSSASNDVNAGQINICDGYECPKNAIENVELRVGILGPISKKFCQNCADKFRGIEV